VGEGADQRGYPAGQTVEIGKPDADRIRRQKEHDFDLERVAGHCASAPPRRSSRPTPCRWTQLQKKLPKLSEGS
jgi:hypothetical protein